MKDWLIAASPLKHEKLMLRSTKRNNCFILIKFLITASLIFCYLSILYGQEALPDLIKKVQSSIVTICCTDLDKTFCRRENGFSITEKGHLVTNYQVIKDATVSKFTTSDGKEYSVDNGDCWVERVLALRETCRLRGLPTYPILVEAIDCSFKNTTPDQSWT